MTSVSANATTSENARTRRSRKLRRTPLTLGEGVPGTPHCEDEARIRGVVLELLAQMAHVDVDRLLVLVERLVVADELEQLASREDAPGPRCQVAQDLELGCREADAIVTATDPASLEIDDEVTVADLASARRIGQV